MLNKISKLQEIGLSPMAIEKKSCLGHGTITRILKTGKYRETTKAKITNYYLSIIKKLTEEL